MRLTPASRAEASLKSSVTLVRGLRLSAAANLRIRSEPADWLCRTDDLS